MHRYSLLALFAVCAAAQDTGEALTNPPSRVDQALRARITEFYQDHVKQEFRKAEALVAPDTKEYFYSHNKPGYLSCETSKITYSDHYKRAKAIVTCEQYVMIPGFADKPLKVPFGSTWKVINGKWFWYVDQEAIARTPFGQMTPGPKGPGGGLPAAIPDNADFVMTLVKVDRAAVVLNPGEPDTVTIKNGAPGLVDISLASKIPGIEATLDHTNLKVGDHAVLTLKAGEGAKSGTITIQVDPTGQTIPIQVTVR
ncbi:MAG TPA: hypothetical protein VKU19_09525 [Bryobacteraceae bacterium]|nr:hypothetical protein [Bryobacteraceae bacterium]